MNIKEQKLAAYLLDLASKDFGRHVCNDVDEKIFTGWTNEERVEFVKEYHAYNGDPEEFDPKFLHIPDYALMSFLSSKLDSIASHRETKLSKIKK